MRNGGIPHRVPDVMGTEYSGLVSQATHDAMGEDVSGHVGIHCSQGIVQEVDGFVLGGRGYWGG